MTHNTSQDIPERAFCPFTGSLVDIVKGDGVVVARGPFWSTRLYKDENGEGLRQLLHDLHMRDGKAPAFSRRDGPRIEVGRTPDEQRQDDAAARDLAAEASLGVDLANSAREYVARRVVSTQN